MNNNIENKYYKLKPLIFSVFLLPVIIYLILNKGDFIFIDFVNLLIHEGGHGIFRIFGKFIYTLGGSLMQLLIPSMFVIFYALHNQVNITQLSLVWLGENFMNVSKYVADASTMKLPLLGGNRVYHDWNYLLGRLNLLEYDTTLGNIVYGIGILCFIAAIFFPIMNKRNQKINLELNL